MGTTHADHFRGDVPVTRDLTREEVEGEYERNTGLVIVERFREGGISPEEVSAVLVANHGPFTWGKDAFEAVEHARVLEYVARMERRSARRARRARRPRFLVDRHFLRKHGKAPTTASASVRALRLHATATCAFPRRSGRSRARARRSCA
jgi:L-ribulose-5-phosphate 4-epimerase